MRQSGCQLTLAEILHAGGPVGFGNAALEQAGVLQAEACGPQGGNRGARIDLLVLSGHFRQRQIEQAGLVLIDQPSVVLAHMVFLPVADQRRAQAVGDLFQHRFAALVLLTGDDHGRAGFDDAAFFRGNGLDVGSEKIGVINGDRRDHAHKRLFDHIGGIETPAQTDLEQHKIGGMLGKQQQGRRRCHFKKRHRLARIGGFAA